MKEMNKSQFKAIAESKYIKLKVERTVAVMDVIFDGSSSNAAEKKHGLCAGTVQRDVNRIKDFYALCLDVAKRPLSKKI